MLTVSQKTETKSKDGSIRKGRSYNEVTEYLDSIKAYDYSEKSLERMMALDRLFDKASEKIDTILVGGTNGKSSTINFATKLLKEEGYKVGCVYSSHFLSYNERVALDFQNISNKAFTEVVNEVITAAQRNNIEATSFEIMTMASLLYFKAENVDVALLEVGMGGRLDATAICNPKIAAVTRIADDHKDVLGDDLDDVSFEMMGIAKQDSWFISAEQSKLRLQKMKQRALDHGISWAMPIRKLSALPYIFEQLYGRIASLGERIAQIYVEDVKGKFSPFLRGNLLATQRGQRGRPTLEAKRQAELNPIKTLKSFWTEQFDLLRGRFEILDKEKPTILLDNARNIDALTNVFLGIRLLHYQRPIKGLAMIVGFNKSVDVIAALKLIRYLLKKVAGNVFFVPLPDDEPSHDVQEVMAAAKELNIKGKAYPTYAQALQAAKSSVDERHGLVCITGSAGMVTQYWRERGIKKL